MIFESILRYDDYPKNWERVRALVALDLDQREAILGAEIWDPGLSDESYDFKLAAADFTECLSMLEIASLCGVLRDPFPVSFLDTTGRFLRNCLDLSQDFRASPKENALLFGSRISGQVSPLAFPVALDCDLLFRDFFAWTVDIETQHETNALYSVLSAEGPDDQRWTRFVAFWKQADRSDNEEFLAAGQGVLKLSDLLPALASILERTEDDGTLRDQLWIHHKRWLSIDPEDPVNRANRLFALLSDLQNIYDADANTPMGGTALPGGLRERMGGAMKLFDKSLGRALRNHVDTIRDAQHGEPA